jgi:hypothetical protein
MIGRLFTASVLTGFALTASAAAELGPGSGLSIQLGAFRGVVYYTVEQDGYRVVATLASDAEALPIRVISTLASGQRFVISAPRSVNQRPVDLEIMRNGDELVVGNGMSASNANIRDEGSIPAVLAK